MRNRFVLPMLCSLAIPAGVGPAPAQEVQREPMPAPVHGFPSDPGLGAVLDYRLPDWGFHNWRLGLEGFTRGVAIGHEQRDINSTFEARSSVLARRESESRWWQALTWMSLQAARGEHHPDQGVELSSTSFQGVARLDLEGARYYARDWSLQGGFEFYSQFQEGRSRSERAGWPTSESSYVRRLYTLRLELGPAWGRIRDVTPVLLALRVAERWAAMGRPPLARQQVLDLAELLAADGYDAVHDRPDKFFRHDLFHAFTGGEPLPARDVFFLLEGIEDGVGRRRQGLQVATRAFGRRRAASGQDPEAPGDDMGLAAELEWSRQLGVDQQLAAVAGVEYAHVLGDGRHEWTVASISLSHLLLLVDRYHWDNRVSFGGRWWGEAPLRPRQEGWSSSVDSSLEVWLEDRFAFVPRVHVDYLPGQEGQSEHAWQWEISLGFEYRLSSHLY